ncbi:hypothetical protein [Sedimentibacter sp.]|nr:hypothetical protein [Sedimentibacter sp.]
MNIKPYSRKTHYYETDQMGIIQEAMIIGRVIGKYMPAYHRRLKKNTHRL